MAGGEEISTLNISDPDVDTEDALEWDVLQDVIHRSKAVTGKDFEDDFFFIFFSIEQMGMGQNPGTFCSPQNSWDLWMFIPLYSNGIFIGIDPQMAPDRSDHR